MLILKLWCFLYKDIMEKEKPWPKVHYIRPKFIYKWNILKGGVDIYSRVKFHNNFLLSGWDTKARLYARSLMAAF